MLTVVWEDAPKAALSELLGTALVDQFPAVLKSLVPGVQVTVAPIAAAAIKAGALVPRKKTARRISTFLRICSTTPAPDFPATPLVFDRTQRQKTSSRSRGSLWSASAKLLTKNHALACHAACAKSWNLRAFTTRMGLGVGLQQLPRIHGGVNLGGGQRGVAQQFLHTAQIAAALQNMGCEGMPQGMRRGFFR